ncbi:MAG: ATP-binding cassette domain-containing protein [Hydrogenophaga sp.]|uniref:ATP-binding cassette domain-containing protein n=1 Tax=Hydrogenophaga sp. TaxID=1904254 RepID=UPI00168FA053|nr:ATP-binding cassette domain-containing protein [Hydrogenophaga sp.]NIM41732.1 ATP-binding cassette domain-containing protein [Hydrogenophaga sp.]NIN27037.1 ATP-binding cassette domain-containing protein [Hydrogenophaga sp.]NIN31738.1 ATP-binding cassette domain-containing protein [Hydrogenophaga sp.]NIN55982.1 ATP-binding cassette domain-containing protein [Hydrogenophaga sp.]NIO52109.1 ATP-binding cassette domain-containing protein [Hydrogenophaga sp.]
MDGHDTTRGASTRSAKGILSALGAVARRHRRRTLLAIALLVLAKLASVCVPLVLKEVVDRFSAPATMATDLSADASAAFPAGTQLVVLPVFLLIGYAALRFSATLFTELRDLCFARVTLATVADFSQKALAHLHAMGPRFHLQRQMGGLVRDVDRGAVALGFLLSALLFTLLPTLVEIVAVMLIMAAAYSPWFIAILLLTFLAYAVHTALMTRRRVLIQRRVNALDSRANGLLMDSLVNQEAVRAHARAPHEVARYGGARGAWVERSVDNQSALSVLHLGQAAIIAVGVGAVMLLAGQETMQGRMTVGDLVLVNAYVLQVCLPLNALGMVFREARDALTNAERLWDLLRARPDIEDSPRARPLSVSRGEVVFDHVDFAYEPGRQILWDVSLRIAPGQTVAVVGGSGSGKSTLARLLLRLYDPQKGRVLVDGEDLGSVTLASLRAAVGIVPQDSTLFNETIAYNIAYGRPGATMAEVLEAARAAQVDEFIASLPQQYDTVVGERGMKLSGGEKQRIAIARAFLKNAPILILDEATSALDTRSERAIQGQLDRLSADRTTLVIAHRLSTIVDADRILVMDRGRIVEQGRHEQLIELGGLYAQLWDLQRQKQAFDRLERQLARQPVNLAALLASVIDGLRPRLDARAIQLYTVIDPEGARVLGDPGVLSQVMWDLGQHAVESTPPGGRVELRLERHQERVRLTVADGRHDGNGATPTVSPEAPAMDPLALRSAIERQGGQFNLVAATSVQGMRYLVDLPLHALAAPPPADDRPPAEAGQDQVHRLAGLLVMVVDDKPMAREALEAVLKAAGAATVGFGGGEPALRWIEDHPAPQWPRVLVCDIALEEEDGFSVVRRLRQIETRHEAPLDQRISAVAVTGGAQPEHRIRALMAGFQMVLSKPVAPDELVATVLALATRPGAGAGALSVHEGKPV